MLRIVTWLAVYTLLVYALGRVVRPWKDRSWFKASFLPGTVLGVLVQKVAAALCLSTRCRCSPLGDRRPAFDVDTARVPVLAGALFVLLSHVLFYVVFLFGVSYLEARGSLNAHVVSLPDIPTYQAMEGYFHLDAREYVEGVRELRRNWSRRPLVLSLTFYVVAGALASLTVSGLQFRWSIIALGTLAGLTYFGDYLEIGFPFLSRGWWAGFSQFPSWWALFSFYVTQGLFALGLFGAARCVASALTVVARPREDDDEEPADRRE